jgi:hypothetical protein
MGGRGSKTRAKKNVSKENCNVLYYEKRTNEEVFKKRYKNREK